MAATLHQDFVDLLIKELSAAGLQVGSTAEFTQRLQVLEDQIQEAGHQFFVAHPELDETPYVVFIIRSALTGQLEMVPAVGNACIQEQKKEAVASLYSGAMKREVIRDS